MRHRPFRLNRSGIMLAIVSAAFAHQAGAAAGRAEFVIGGVNVARNGVERPLTRGTELDNGDTVRTNDGRAQIRFTDGAYVSLQPNTEYSIRDYRYDSQGNERGFFGLLKGAMRTVTGAIGRINRDRYQIATPTATVGIRGTGGVIQVQEDGSTLVIGTSGIWSLTNPAGSVDVPAGTSAVAPSDPNQPPQESSQQPTSGPAPVPEEQLVFAAGEEVDEEGLPIIPEPSTETVSGMAGALAYGPFGLDGGLDGTVTFDSFGRAIEMISPEGGIYRLESGSHLDSATDGILTWGRWIGTVNVPICEGTCTQTLENYSSNQGFHYVVGLPTATMPISGTATYTLLGATSPTYGTDTGVGPGTLSASSSLSVDFVQQTVGVNLGITMPDSVSYTIGGTAQISGPEFFGSHSFGSGSLTLSGGSCGSCGCQAAVAGFFAGSNAERAGLGYHVFDSIANKEVFGAAGFEVSAPRLLLDGGL